MNFKYPTIVQSWPHNWEQVIPFSACAPAVRKILYTTNAIESSNAQVREAVRVRGHFPSEEAATKLIWLVFREVQARWINPPVFWRVQKPSWRSSSRIVSWWRNEHGCGLETAAG